MSDFERIFSIEKHRTIERNDYEYKIGNDLCFRKPSYIDESDPESPLAKKKKLIHLHPRLHCSRHIRKLKL